MTVQELQNQINDVITQYPKTYVRVLQKSKKYLLDALLKRIPDVFKNEKFSNKTKIYYFLNNLNEPYKCYCGNILYRLDTQTCSAKCAQNSKNVRDKIRQTNINKTGTPNGHGVKTLKKMRKNALKKRGVAHHTQSAEFKNKIKEINLEKFNVEHVFQRSDVKEKIKETNLERYGVENVFQNERIKQQITNTFLDRYGVLHPMQSQEIRDTTKNTVLNRYGVENVMELPDVKDKIKATTIERYGVEYSSQAATVKEKAKNTNLERYGATTYAGSVEAKQKTKLNFFQRILETNKLVSPLFSESEFNYDDFSKNLKWFCKECKQEFYAPINYNWWRYHGHNAYARCPICYPFITIGISKYENELFDFVKSVCPGTIQSDRNIIAPQELDIFIPSKNIAIEFDGLYWHSDDIKPNNYHLKKTEMCEKKNIHLIHIFENEWVHKQEIVKSRINSILENVKNIGARQCEIVELENDEMNLFLDNNHLQGFVNAKIKLGLVFKNELVSVMTFSKPRFSKKYEYELLRFCNKLNISVTGGASKLLKYFEKKYKPESIISYADRRWSYIHKNIYQLLDFELSHKSEPNYWYWKNDEFSHRLNFQKHKLHKLLKTFDGNLTESENMYLNGFKRIFDCGNLVYVKKYQKSVN